MEFWNYFCWVPSTISRPLIRRIPHPRSRCFNFYSYEGCMVLSHGSRCVWGRMICRTRTGVCRCATPPSGSPLLQSLWRPPVGGLRSSTALPTASKALLFLSTEYHSWALLSLGDVVAPWGLSYRIRLVYRSCMCDVWPFCPWNTGVTSTRLFQIL